MKTIEILCVHAIHSPAGGMRTPIGDDYYQDIPHEENIPMGIDLNALTDGHSILITQATNLNYALSAFGKKINKVWFTMGNKEWELSDQPTGSLSITRKSFCWTLYADLQHVRQKAIAAGIADQFDNDLLWRQSLMARTD